MLIDVHVHSSYTKGVEVDNRALLAAAAEAGLDGVCITDRDSTKHAVELIKLGAQLGVEVFIGLEIQTDHGVMLGFAPRIDGFYLNEEWRQLQGRGTPSAQSVVSLFEQIGGAVVAAYPYDGNVAWASGDRLFAVDGLSAIESFVPRLPQMRNCLAIEAARALNVSNVGGSDFKGDLSVIGTAGTLFPEEVASQAQFVAGIKGDCWPFAFGLDLDDAPPVRHSDGDDRRRGGRDGGRRGGRDGGRGGRDGGRGGRDGGRGGRDGGRGGRDGGRGGRDGGRGGRDGGRGGRDGGRGGRGGRSRRSGGEGGGGESGGRRPRPNASTPRD